MPVAPKGTLGLTARKARAKGLKVRGLRFGALELWGLRFRRSHSDNPDEAHARGLKGKATLLGAKDRLEF